MLKRKPEELQKLEMDYAGIIENIMRFENQLLPACPSCGSDHTAVIQFGVIGRTILIAGATTKIKLLPNKAPDDPSKFFCNQCERYF